MSDSSSPPSSASSSHNLSPLPDRPELRPFQSWIIKAGVWLVFFGILYLLRSFFLLIFLTFVFAYIQAAVVERLKPSMPHRTLRVIASGVLLLSVISAVATFLVPRVRQEATQLADRFPSYVQDIDLELARLTEGYPSLLTFLPALHPVTPHPDQHDELRVPHDQPLQGSLTLRLLQESLGGKNKTEENNVAEILGAVRDAVTYLGAISSAFLLSLLFSFLIVLDLPRLTQSAKRLKFTKLGFIYDEVAPSIVEFGQVVGRAFEAQLAIAALNTTLTALGLILLGLTEKLAFFSVIVFFCSFIPVAGVFISSAPICLIALQQGGWGLSLLAALLITVVHMLEAYVLNPKIYGHHLRMNPVLVLIILTVGGKLLGVWGLVLGVPVCTYIFGHAIQYKDEENAGQAA